MKKLIIILLIMPSFVVFSQHGHEEHFVKGRVFQVDSMNQQIPLAFANVYWLQSMEGVISDSLGRFRDHINIRVDE